MSPKGPIIAFLCAVASACTEMPSRSPAAAVARGVQGSVDVRDMGADGAHRYAASANVEYVQPLGCPGNAMPDYPRELLALRLPDVVAHARVVVDANGRALDVAALDEGTGAERARFFDAVRAACPGWRDSPLLRLDLSGGPVAVQEGRRR